MAHAGVTAWRAAGGDVEAGAEYERLAARERQREGAAFIRRQVEKNGSWFPGD
jgi:hypothetical protein